LQSCQIVPLGFKTLPDGRNMILSHHQKNRFAFAESRAGE
jgi:hypothetical protein